MGVGRAGSSSTHIIEQTPVELPELLPLTD
jgi:hypothetical protein